MTTNGDSAWGNFLAQFKDGTQLSAFVRSLYGPMDLQDAANTAMLLDRWLNTAVGAQLDGLGRIVGQSREQDGAAPLTDSEYRQTIRWKIAVNTGKGTAPDVAKAMSAIFGATNTTLIDQGNAHVTVLVDVQENLDGPLIVNPDRWVPIAAGVNLYFAGFRQMMNLLTEDSEDLITEDGQPLIVEYFQAGL